jgi:hypothetical protein
MSIGGAVTTRGDPFPVSTPLRNHPLSLTSPKIKIPNENAVFLSLFRSRFSFTPYTHKIWNEELQHRRARSLPAETVPPGRRQTVLPPLRPASAPRYGKWRCHRRDLVGICQGGAPAPLGASNFLVRGGFSVYALAIWRALGAVASASRLHRVGRRFESCSAHQPPLASGEHTRPACRFGRRAQTFLHLIIPGAK